MAMFWNMSNGNQIFTTVIGITENVFNIFGAIRNFHC